MALTRFPIETTNPKIEVTLPIGRHVLELVVEDSAGLRSAPDQIVIEVRKEAAAPVVTGILPVSAVRGATVEAVISGANLAGATAVTFSGTGVTASIGSGGTAASLPVKITIAADAATGARSFTVTTPSGTAGSPAGVSLTVSALEPRIIEPRVIEPRVIAQPISIEPTPISTQPVVVDPSPIATRLIAVEPIPTSVQPIVVDPSPVATRPIAIEPLAITPEVRAVVAEPRLVTPVVTPVVEARVLTPERITTPTPVIEARAVTPDIGRVITPGKAATGTTKTAATTRKTTATRKKK